MQTFLPIPPAKSDRTSVLLLVVSQQSFNFLQKQSWSLGRQHFPPNPSFQQRFNSSTVQESFTVFVDLFRCMPSWREEILLFSPDRSTSFIMFQERFPKGVPSRSYLKRMNQLSRYPSVWANYCSLLLANPGCCRFMVFGWKHIPWETSVYLCGVSLGECDFCSDVGLS